VKRKLALGIAGASALLVAGWRIVQSESESAFSGEGGEPTPAQPPAPEQPPAPKPAPETPADAPADPTGSATVSPASTAPDTKVPDGASKAELYEIAQGLKIKGRSNMSKAELRRAIEAEG